MNQIVISKFSDEKYKVNVMGQGRTEETYYMPEKIIADNLHLLLQKLVLTENAV